MFVIKTIDACECGANPKELITNYTEYSTPEIIEYVENMYGSDIALSDIDVHEEVLILVIVKCMQKYIVKYYLDEENEDEDEEITLILSQEINGKDISVPERRRSIISKDDLLDLCVRKLKRMINNSKDVEFMNYLEIKNKMIMLRIISEELYEEGEELETFSETFVSKFRNELKDMGIEKDDYDKMNDLMDVLEEKSHVLFTKLSRIM